MGKKIINAYLAKTEQKLRASAVSRAFLHLLMFILIDHRLAHIEGIMREL